MDKGNIQSANINWYPGHMAKAVRLLQQQLRNVDFVIELCDARLPFSSRNPVLKRMGPDKKRIIVLNKADLADEKKTEEWLKYFRSAGDAAVSMNSREMNRKKFLSYIGNVCEEINERYSSRGIRKIARAMVIGVPNVGKSTFINRLHGSNIARTGDKPGVTRNNQWIRISSYFELLDTPGLLWPRLDDQKAALRLCYIGSVSDEVTDISDIALSLLQDLKEASPESVKDRFHISDTNKPPVEMIDDICRGRGLLLPGGNSDYDRCFRLVLNEYRDGKLGRLTLETVKNRSE